MLRPLRDQIDDVVVRCRLRHAFDTMSRVPSRDWPQGYRLHSCIGLTEGQSERRPAGDAPTRYEITMAEQALQWLEHVRDEPEEVRHALHLRASGATYRRIGARLDCSHVWARKLEARAVARILAKLRRRELLPGLSTFARRAA